MKFLRYIIPFLLLLPGLSGLSQISFSTDPLPAVGCDSLEVTFTFNNIPPPLPISSVEWDFGNDTTATGIGPHTIMYDSAGMYTVNVLVNNTTSLPPKNIYVYPTPRAVFVWSDSIELGSYTVSMINPPKLVDTINYFYQWFIENQLAGDVRGIIYTFPQPLVDYPVKLIVTNEIGCADTVTRIVYVMDMLECPNVFTPNQDGRNDNFVVGSNGLTIYNMQVFSQNGILVYKTEAPLIIWDGRNLSGQELSPGTYYYIIKPINGAGSSEKKGFVELYR